MRAPARGIWKDDSGETTRDDIIILEVMTDDLIGPGGAPYGKIWSAGFVRRASSSARSRAHFYNQWSSKPAITSATSGSERVACSMSFRPAWFPSRCRLLPGRTTRWHTPRHVQRTGSAQSPVEVLDCEIEKPMLVRASPRLRNALA